MSHEELKARLEAELADITAQLKTIATHNPETGDWIAIPAAGTVGNADENVAADAAEEWEKRRALMPQLETRYRNVKRALEKFSAGTYGVCELSGKPIELERLEANPAARTNIANRNREEELPL
jgi:RNA polymerase-binding transcription factor DksA